jgi:hypothetical protein
MDETNVRKAHKGKDETQVRNLVIERGHWRTFGVAASTRDDHERLLPCAGQQAFGCAVSFVPESLPRPNDVIDPRLERSGNRKVVHGGCENDFVGFEKFGNQFVRERERLLVVFRVVFGRREGSRNPVDINEGERCLS